jgi:SNF2 family DNA or RNA helicase
VHGLEVLADPPQPEPQFVTDLRAKYWLYRARLTPFAHQVVGVDHLVRNPYAAIFDEMGAGKTKQVVDAAQVMMAMTTEVKGKKLPLIDRVLIVCPASVRGVWYDPELGELQKHLWIDDTKHRVVEFHARKREWSWGRQDAPPDRQFQWVVTNYDFIRQEPRLLMLLKWLKQGRGLLVLDESSAVKNWSAQQTEASNFLRLASSRVVLLNGTPIAHSPLDMYAQARLMHPSILACKTFFHFRAKYAVLGGYKQRQIIGWQQLDDLQARLKPYVVRRLKADCLDLPPKLPPVTLSVALSEDTWRIYREMRDELLVFLEHNVSATQHAFVKAIRLAQITSGFVGGVVAASDLQLDLDLFEPDERPEWLARVGTVSPSGPEVATWSGAVGLSLGQPEGNLKQQNILEVGREKLDLFLSWLRDRLDETPNFKVVVFSRFRHEVERLDRELRFGNHGFAGVQLGKIIGGQKRDEREAAIRLLDPRTTPDAPVVVAGTQDSGSLGMTLTAASTMFRLSVNYNLKVFLQGQDRIHRPTQLWPCSYFDAVATGPQGQKTIDHAVLKALYAKEDVATWTQAAWLTALREE